MGLDPGLHFFARGSFLFPRSPFLAPLAPLPGLSYTPRACPDTLESLEVETEGREAKVEPPGSPTPHLYSPPILAVAWASQDDGDIYSV
jgi:hypothetical protein